MSLVHFDEDAGRYRLLETIRQYALDRLMWSGEHDRAYFDQLEFLTQLGLVPERRQAAGGRCCSHPSSFRSCLLIRVDGAS